MATIVKMLTKEEIAARKIGNAQRKIKDFNRTNVMSVVDRAELTLNKVKIKDKELKAQLQEWVEIARHQESLKCYVELKVTQSIIKRLMSRVIQF